MKLDFVWALYEMAVLRNSRDNPEIMNMYESFQMSLSLSNFGELNYRRDGA